MRAVCVEMCIVDSSAKSGEDIYKIDGDTVV